MYARSGPPPAVADSASSYTRAASSRPRTQAAGATVMHDHRAFSSVTQKKQQRPGFAKNGTEHGTRKSSTNSTMNCRLLRVITQPTACMAAVLVGVMPLLGCPFDGAWCLVCAFCLLVVMCVPCLVCSLAVPGVCSFHRVTQPTNSTTTGIPSRSRLAQAESHLCTVTGKPWDTGTLQEAEVQQPVQRGAVHGTAPTYVRK